MPKPLTINTMVSISEKSLDEFIELMSKEGATFKYRNEAYEAANNLVNFAKLLWDMACEEKVRERRLAK